MGWKVSTEFRKRAGTRSGLPFSKAILVREPSNV
jgi:hypothetical protein